MTRPTPRAIGILLTLAVPALLAFAVSGNRWLNGTALFHTAIPGTAPSGIDFAAAFEAAMGEWNAKTDFEFRAQRAFVDPCTGYARSGTSNFPSGDGDATNSIDFRSNVCGNDFGSTVLAITLTFATAGRLGFDQLREADIIFNDRLTWDVYAGPRKVGLTDFRRVALHELGHALGLSHEPTLTALMAPRISDVDKFQLDDIAGAESIYGIPRQCNVADLRLNSLLRNSLDQQDCQVLQLFGGGVDDSFVDVYRLKLSTRTRIVLDMNSAVMDPVLVLTDSKLNELDIADDHLGNCNARMDKTLAAGEYLVLANTYAKPSKCGGNVGGYTLTYSDGLQPVMGDAATLNSHSTAWALFTGGATANGVQTFRSVFDPHESIDVNARIAVDPSHIGQSGKVFVLLQLSNGNLYNKNAAGDFVPYTSGNPLTPLKSGALAALETINVVKGFKAEGTGLAGLSVAIYTGYALDARPQDIHYGTAPIRFSINP